VRAAPTDPEAEPMSIWVDAARVATALNVVLAGFRV
jgi:hypothetical protein